MTLFFITKFDDIRATTRFDTLIEIVIVRFDALIKIVIARFNTLIEIVIIESATNKVVTNNVATANAIASNAITNIITILLKTRLI